MIRKSWSGYAPVEAALESLASALRDVKSRMRQLFAQERTAVNAGLFLDGLLSEEQRKTGWMRSEAAGDPGPWRQQELLGRDRWNADALRDLVREYVVEHLRSAVLRSRGDTPHPEGARLRAMIALVCDVAGNPLGIHRVASPGSPRELR
jgi:hypothetical protein